MAKKDSTKWDFFSTRLPRETTQQLRIYAVVNKMTVQAATQKIMRDFLEKNHIEIIS